MQVAATVAHPLTYLLREHYMNDVYLPSAAPRRQEAEAEGRGAMRVAAALVAGLSPALHFALQQEFGDFGDDLLIGMFEHPPPYRTLEQLLQGLQPRVGARAPYASRNPYVNPDNFPQLQYIWKGRSE